MDDAHALGNAGQTRRSDHVPALALHGIARQTRYGNQTTVEITSARAADSRIAQVLTKVSAFLRDQYDCGAVATRPKLGADQMPRLLTGRSPPRILSEAASGSLKPLPTEQFRRAHLHLPYSRTLSRLLDTPSLRNVLEPLSGSRHGTTPHSHLPVRPQLRIASRDTRDPMCRPAQMTTQVLIFPLGPAGQRSIQLAHWRIERRPVKPSVILEPASNDRVEHATDL